MGQMDPLAGEASIPHAPARSKDHGTESGTRHPRTPSRHGRGRPGCVRDRPARRPLAPGRSARSRPRARGAALDVPPGTAGSPRRTQLAALTLPPPWLDAGMRRSIDDHPFDPLLDPVVADDPDL